MGLKVKDLSLKNWRNIPKKSISLSSSLTIFQGPNASGKTNTLEALQTLCTGHSFKKTKVAQLLTEEKKEGEISAILVDKKRKINLSLSLQNKDKTYKKQFFKNNKKISPSLLSGILPTVLFTPDHLGLIKNSAQTRRDEIDFFCMQLSSSFQTIYKEFHRTLEQRNKLLKERYINFDLLSTWDEALALGGATIFLFRRQFLKHLKTHLITAYQNLSSTEHLDFSYSSSFLPEENQDILQSLPSIETKEEVAQLYLEALQKTRETDTYTGYTSLGPHRDDIVFFLNNKDARLYASQGQQRSIVLAWKIALITYCQEYLAQEPLLLLDDVMSELDETRREAITKFLTQDIQTIITTTHPGYFSSQTLQQAEVITFP